MSKPRTIGRSAPNVNFVGNGIVPRTTLCTRGAFDAGTRVAFTLLRNKLTMSALSISPNFITLSLRLQWTPLRAFRLIKTRQHCLSCLFVYTTTSFEQLID